MKTSIYDLAHSKGVPIAVTKAMLAMRERIAELEGAQPVQITWVGLTDEELKEIVCVWGDTPINDYTRKLFDKFEAKLKEKNT